MYSEKPLLHKRQKASQPGNLCSVSIDVTSRCNMTCNHCYAETFADAELVADAPMIQTLDELYDLGVHHYILQGGEAILEKQRLELILEHCRPLESYINLVSNGRAMTPKRIRWLKERHVDKITFSLDSGIREEHDANRCARSFDCVLQAVDDVLCEGLLPGISTVVTNQSLYSEGFRSVVEFVKRRKIRLDVQIAEPVGKWDGRRDCLITPADAAYIRRLRESLGSLPNGQAMINRDIYRSGGPPHCPAGTEFISLTADGNILPCNFIQFTLGNIRDRSVSEMRTALLHSAWFNDAHPVCIVGEDHDFIDKFIVANVGRAKPLDAYEVFGLPRPESRKADDARTLGVTPESFGTTASVG